MKAKLYKCDTGETSEIDTQFLTLLQWVKINFSYWGFYEIKRVGTNKYEISDKHSKQLKYKIN